MSAAKESVNEGCRTPESANSSDAKKKSRERKKKSLGPDFESSWPEDSTPESDKFETPEEQEELLGNSSSGEPAETDDEDIVAPKTKRRKQIETDDEDAESPQKRKKKGHATKPTKKKATKSTKQTKLLSKEKQLQIVTAECQQVKELVTIDLSTEDLQAAPNSNKRVPQGCKNLLCTAEKDKLREEIKVLKQTLADYAASKEISAPVNDKYEPLRYGKVPRQAALNRKWEEIGNGVWICPLRLRAAQKDAKSKTAFARMLLMFFYKKEELKGKRLHELDQDIVHAVAEFALIAKLQCKPYEEGKGNEKKPQEESKAAIMQSLRTKLNNLIQEDEQKKKRQEKRKQEARTKLKELVASNAAESL